MDRGACGKPFFEEFSEKIRLALMLCIELIIASMKFEIAPVQSASRGSSSV